MATKKEAAVNEQEQSAAGVPAQDAASAEAERIIAQARAEADKIVADAKAQAEAAVAEAETASPSRARDPGDELVPIQLFKDGERYKDDVFVAVNGERVLIKRGELVRVKRKFADVLEQSIQQDTATASMMDRQSAEYEAQAKANILTANTTAAATRRGKVSEGPFTPALPRRFQIKGGSSCVSSRSMWPDTRQIRTVGQRECRGKATLPRCASPSARTGTAWQKRSHGWMPAAAIRWR